MKVIALETVRHNRVIYTFGQEFDHETPEKAIELGLVKLAEDGEEVDSSGIKGVESSIHGKRKKD